MPNLSEQLSAILQNPEAQQNIRNILSSLQQNQNPQEQIPPQNGSGMPFDLSSLFGNQNSPPQNGNQPAFDINTVLKLQEIFSKMSCDDKNVCLLRALKPYLHEPKKADDAIRMLQLISVLPALKECGIFGGGPL